MNIINKYNHLQGKSLTRAEIRQFIRAAKKEKVPEIVNNLAGLLRKYPNQKGFEFTKVTQIKIKEDFEGLGIPYLSPEHEKDLGTTEIEGLGKRVSNDSIYQMVTDRIIETIDKGTSFWNGKHNGNKGGKTNDVIIGLPVNFSNKKAYRGINSIVLSFYPKKTGIYTDHNGNERDKVEHVPIEDGRLFWMTMKQIKEKKGKLKKGSKSNQAVFYNWIFLYKGEKISEARYRQLKAKFGCSPLNKSEQCDELKKIAYLRYYNVFNERDIEGIDFEKARKKQNENADKVKSNEQKILAADLVIKHMPNKPQLKIKHLSTTESPHYSPSRDYVMMPQKEQYNNVAEWYGTAFHEFVHSTGNTKRLGRFQQKDYRGGRNGNNAYALEELVAEIGAAFLNAESGIMLTNLKNNAAYIKGWARAVKKELKSDNKAIFKAAGQSQKAADYILNFDKNGDPAYWKEYEKIQKEIKVRGAKQKTEKKKQNIKSKYTDQTGLKSEVLKNGLWTKLLSPGDIRFISLDEVRIFKFLSSYHFTNGKTEIVISDGKTRKVLKKRSRVSKEVKEVYNNSLKSIVKEKISKISKPKKSKKKDKKISLENKDLPKPGDLTNDEIKQLSKEYFSDILWNDRVNKYMKAVISEGKKRGFKKYTDIQSKVNDSGQMALFGLKKVQLVTDPKPVKPESMEPQTRLPVRQARNPEQVTRNPLVKSINHRPERRNENFLISGDIGTFLGDVEIKPYGSVACTLDAPQGAGKTRFFFQIINELAKNYKVLFISLEEHPESQLFQEKVNQYIEPQNQNNIDTVGGLERGKEKQTLDSLIPNYDVVLIDSWNKIYETAKLDFDNDLRKAYHGKLIFAIFQRTVTGSMRGGAKAQFDGDIIMKIEKGEDFKENFVFHDKNRYQNRDLTQLKYNIFNQRLDQLLNPPNGEASLQPQTQNPLNSEASPQSVAVWDDTTITI